MSEANAPQSPPPRWYALAVHARQEKAAAQGLAERGVEVFLPVRVDRRAWSDRVQNVEVALFPGYLFTRVALDPAARVRLLQVRQVIELVGRLPGEASIAQAVPDAQIESLRLVVGAAANLDPTERLVPGTEVVVASGALKGARGVVVLEPNGKRRLVVQIELLGRGVAAELDADALVEARD